MEYRKFAEIVSDLLNKCRDADRLQAQIKDLQDSVKHVETLQAQLQELQPKIDELRKYVANY